MEPPRSPKKRRPQGRSEIAIARLALAAILALGGWLVLSQYVVNRHLQSTLARLSDETEAITAQRAENRHLEALAANTASLRRAVVALAAKRARSASPSREPSPVPRPVLAEIVVTPAKTIEWDGVEITLYDFIHRFASAAADPANAKGEIVVRDSASDIRSLAYVIDEIRKAGITHLVVHSDATPSGPVWMKRWF